MDLLLAPGILDEIIQSARQTRPFEACGLLVGRNRTAERYIPMKNIAASASEFEMDAAELIAALRDLRRTGEELAAIFHSHPNGPAAPSRRDVEHAYYPEAAHVIVSLAEPERPQAVGFRIIDGQVLPIELRVIV